MLIAYFDASRPPSSVVVAGYVAPSPAWDRFNRKWFAVLQDIPYFHMKEFAHSIKAFAHLKSNEEKRIRIITGLCEAIRDHALEGYATEVSMAVWNAVNEKYCVVERFGHPYALAGRDCVNRVFNGMRHHGRGQEPIEFIFDHGDQGWGHLVRLLAESGKPKPIRKKALPDPASDWPGSPALQAADFAAWELQKIVREGWRGLPMPLQRRSLQALHSAVNHHWYKYDEVNLIKLCNLGQVPKRRAENCLTS